MPVFFGTLSFVPTARWSFSAAINIVKVRWSGRSQFSLLL